MPDPDIFIRVTAEASSRRAYSVLRLPENEPWLVLAEGTPEPEAEEDHESTPAPTATIGLKEDDDDALVVRFSTLFTRIANRTLPSLNRGLVFGTDPSACHVLLGSRRTAGISGRHCALFTDDTLRTRLRDFSSNGTSLECNNQSGQEKRCRYEWVLTREPAGRPLFDTIVIHTNKVGLRIDFPNYGSSSPQFEENMRTFLTKLNDDTEYFGALKIDSAVSTVAPSDDATPSPGTTEIYYRLEELGRGAFGSVWHAVQARTGTEVAMKKIRRPPMKRRWGAHVTKWQEDIENEFKLMRDHPHPNVVKVFDHFESKEDASFVMEYYPDGNISDANLEEVAYMSAFGQILDGLQHLHSRQVAHRDLKPENILIQWKPFKISIADFGMSKIATSAEALVTFCGSLSHLAPEVAKGHGYGTPSDIWSLGVMVYQWLYSRPQQPPNRPDHRQWALEWCDRVLNSLGNEDDCDLTKLLLHMLELDPKKRWTAQQCLEFGLKQSRLFKRRDSDGLIVCVDHHETSIDQPRNAEEHQTLPTSGSHLSTRSIMHMHDSVFMVINQQKIAMRASSYELNASNLFLAAKLDNNGRRKYRRRFKRQNVGRYEGNILWLPFQHGVFLCQALGLFDVLQPLLLWPGQVLSQERENYLLPKKKPRSPLPEGFATLQCGSHIVAFRPDSQTINARHIANMTAHPKAKLRAFLEENTEWSVYHGNAKVQGTYVHFALAAKLCAYLGISSRPLQALLADGLRQTEDHESSQIVLQPSQAGSPARHDPLPQSQGIDEGYRWGSSLYAQLGWL